MTDKSHDYIVSFLENENEKGNLSPAIKERLAKIIGTETRPQLEKTVETKEDKPADMAEVTKEPDFETQYGRCFDALKHYGFLTENGEAKEGDAHPPTFEKAMSTFKAEELEIASRFQKPTLLLIPETSFAAKIKALRAGQKKAYEDPEVIPRIKRADEIKIIVHKIYKESDTGSDKITGWRAVIVDGAPRNEFIVDGTFRTEVYEGDDLDLRIDERIKNRKAARRPGEKGMDRHKYVLLAMVSIINRKIVDYGRSTLLDDDPASSDSFVPRARFSETDSGSSISFGCIKPDFVYDKARFRSSVGGDILI